MTSYTLSKAGPDKTRADVVVIGVARGAKGALEAAPGGEPVAEAYARKFAPMLSSMGFGGKPGEVLRVPTAGAIKAPQLLVIGLGELSALTTEKVRRAAGVAARNVGNAASVALALPATDAAHVRAVAEGFALGSYTFNSYKSGAKDGSIAEVAILSEAARRQEAIDALARAEVVSAMVAQTRDWVNLPPNDLTPPVFADAVVEFGKSRTPGRKKPKVTVEVLDEKALTELGCGGILAVGTGSAHPPRLVKLTWKPAKPVARIALVGKGITYDSGGLSIKPGGSMATMKMDMAGAATVVTAIQAIAELDLPVSVVAYAPMAENMLSGTAYRPGDIVTTYSGKTVEVTNTDAEGRMILCDAISLAAEQKVDAIIDVATLTGACMVALGDRISGIFGDDGTVGDLLAAAEVTGEMFWQLPIPESTREAVTTSSKVADLYQTEIARWGGALFAAAFLEQFTAGVPWSHLDIAGPAYNDGGPWGHVPSGGTGAAVSTLVEYAARLADQPQG